VGKSISNPSAKMALHRVKLLVEIAFATASRSKILRAYDSVSAILNNLEAIIRSLGHHVRVSEGNSLDLKAKQFRVTAKHRSFLGCR